MLEVLHRAVDFLPHRCVSRPSFCSQILVSDSPAGSVPPSWAMYCSGIQRILLCRISWTYGAWVLNVQSSVAPWSLDPLWRVGSNYPWCCSLGVVAAIFSSDFLSLWFLLKFIIPEPVCKYSPSLLSQTTVFCFFNLLSVCLCFLHFILFLSFLTDWDKMCLFVRYKIFLRNITDKTNLLNPCMCICCET